MKVLRRGNSGVKKPADLEAARAPYVCPNETQAAQFGWMLLLVGAVVIIRADKALLTNLRRNDSCHDPQNPAFKRSG